MKDAGVPTEFLAEGKDGEDGEGFAGADVDCSACQSEPLSTPGVTSFMVTSSLQACTDPT